MKSEKQLVMDQIYL